MCVVVCLLSGSHKGGAVVKKGTVEMSGGTRQIKREQKVRNNLYPLFYLLDFVI